MHRIRIAALLALSALVYARSLTNQFVYDDNEEIRLNHFIGQWSFIWRSFVNDSWWFRNPSQLPQSAYYRPLQDAWFALNYHAFAMNPVGWHLTMIALEVVVVWLVFRVAEELTGDFTSALVAGALFAVMPVHAQAIAWPSAIPLPMSAALELGAMLFVVRRVESSRAWALILFALALLSHESAIMFPALVAAYAFLCAPGATDESPRQRARAALLFSAPFFLVALIYLGVRIAILGFITQHNLGNHLGTYTVLLTTFEVIGQYLVLLVIPWRADPSHAIAPIASPLTPAFYLTLLGIAAISIAAWAILVQRRRVALYQLCALWIFLFLAPVLNLGALNPVELVADRYLFMPSAAWCIALGSLSGELMIYKEARNAVTAIVAAFVFISAAILWHVQGFWQNEIALFTRATQVSPGSSLWHERLGMALKGDGKLDDALRELAAADALDRESGTALYNIALIHLQQGHPKLALEEMVRALPRIKDAPPGAYGEAARVAMNIGDFAKAENLLDQASKLRGGGGPTAIGRAEIKIMQHDDAAAITILKEATKDYPEDSEAWTLLAHTELEQGDYADALIASERAVAYAPNAGWARILHAELLDKAGRHDEAIAEYRRALEVQPDDPQIRTTIEQVKPQALQ